MKFDLEEILTVIDKVKAAELYSFEYRDNDTKIKIKGTRDGSLIRDLGACEEKTGERETTSVKKEPSPKSDPSGNEWAETDCEADEKSVVLASPMVGTFYAAPSEEEEPFVKVGDPVKKGQTVGIVEAMKLMNEIEAECDGVVEAILAKNEQLVEYGQPLVRIREVSKC